MNTDEQEHGIGESFQHCGEEMIHFVAKAVDVVTHMKLVPSDTPSNQPKAPDSPTCAQAVKKEKDPSAASYLIPY